MKWKNKTRGGLPVRIYPNSPDNYPGLPIHGAVDFGAGYRPVEWSPDGRIGSTWDRPGDLVPDVPIIDWSAQPAWCKAVAMDQDGWWNRFEHTPNRSGEMWLRQKNGGFTQTMHPSESPQWDGDWKDSLCVRLEGGGV